MVLIKMDVVIYLDKDVVEEASTVKGSSLLKDEQWRLEFRLS